MNKLTCKLKNVDNLDIQSLQRRIENGHRFIVYQYSISLIVGNIFTASPAYLLKKEDQKKHTFKYSLLSFIFGWWSLDGVTNTLKSLKTNSKGGLDVTEDIMLNLDNISLKARKVKIEELYTIFKQPSKAILKDFTKSINNIIGLNTDQNIYLGQYLNTEGSSYFITFENISETSQEDLMKELRKIFYDHVHIDISEINDQDEVTNKLIEQGIKL
ncbi:hypothetical protein [uncultured Tenacibaculum sp.]|uniref:hypothetical protein n=1 Tax=uncultured Tenacibaculum sp. TaxID=174713 RepID=UPI002601F1F5|nr:hypothetical protein [uncultured Tenacibaculum sp.]